MLTITIIRHADGEVKMVRVESWQDCLVVLEVAWWLVGSAALTINISEEQ